MARTVGSKLDLIASCSNYRVCSTLSNTEGASFSTYHATNWGFFDPLSETQITQLQLTMAGLVEKLTAEGSGESVGKSI